MGPPGLDYPPANVGSTIDPMNGNALNWRLLLGALLAGGAVVAAALAMPVPSPASVAQGDAAATMPEAAVAAAPEELTAFLDIRRWGAPPPAPKPEPAGEVAPTLNPVLAEMGFVGLIAAGDERAVLLALPDGEIVRMLPGDTLPDGRILVSVADNSLSLEAAGGPTEVLTLFPPLPAEETTPAAGGLGEGEQGGGGATLLPGATGAVASQ